MKPINLRSENNYDGDSVSAASGLECLEPTRAQQSFADEVNINTIVRRFGVTGTVPNSLRPPTFGDFTGVGDFQSALASIQAADDSFMSLDAKVRARFDNSPAAFLDFCFNPANLDEMRTLGLAVAEPVIPGAPDVPVEPI